MGNFPLLNFNACCDCDSPTRIYWIKCEFHRFYSLQQASQMVIFQQDVFVDLKILDWEVLFFHEETTYFLCYTYLSDSERFLYFYCEISLSAVTLYSTSYADYQANSKETSFHKVYLA